MIDFVAQHPWLTIFIISLIPFLELKIAIPVGILILGWSNLFHIIGFVVIIQIILAILLYSSITYILLVIEEIPFLRSLGKNIEVRTTKKATLFVKKYGIFSLACFLAVPFPTTGVYTASVFSHFLGYRLKDYLSGCVIGLLISSVLVAFVTFLILWFI